MILAVGKKAIYPCQGPCLIGRVVNRVVNDRTVLFYHLTVLGDSGGELYVPVDKAQAIGVRLLLKRSEIPKLLEHLKQVDITSEHWRQRAIDNLKLFTSGSPYDLAEVIKSLTVLKRKSTLTLGEVRTLDKARKLLIGEISEVMGEAKSVVEEQLDHALNA